MSKGTILVIGSNATELEAQGGGTIKIGQFLNETAVPLMTLVAAGYDFVLATPTGEKPHMDQDSDALIYFANDDQARSRARDFFNNHPSMNDVRTIRSVIDGGLDRFVGLFFPGGHAPVVDVMQDADAGEVLRHFHAHNKPTAAICHGPMGILSSLDNAREFRAALINGDKVKARGLARGWQYAGYRMTVFSRSEEEYAEDNVFHKKLIFNMPDALEAAGGNVVNTDQNFTSFVVVDRELVTAQNPMSDHELAAKFIEALGRAAAVVEPTAQLRDNTGFPLANGGTSVFVPANHYSFSDTGARGEDPNTGIQVANVWGDVTKGAHGAFFQFDPGFVSPLHTHTYDYYAVVIKGEMQNYQPGQKHENLGPGSFWYQRGKEAHTTACVSKEPGLIYIVQQHEFDAQIPPVTE